MLGDLLQYNIFLCPNLGQDKKGYYLGQVKKDKNYYWGRYHLK
jgi:hypothetical protein